eukprot:365906-Chlamydomonas_euryale.AAC.2
MPFAPGCTYLTPTRTHMQPAKQPASQQTSQQRQPARQPASHAASPPPSDNPDCPPKQSSRLSVRPSGVRTNGTSQAQCMLALAGLPAAFQQASRAAPRQPFVATPAPTPNMQMPPEADPLGRHPKYRLKVRGSWRARAAGAGEFGPHKVQGRGYSIPGLPPRLDGAPLRVPWLRAEHPSRRPLLHVPPAHRARVGRLLPMRHFLRWEAADLPGPHCPYVDPYWPQCDLPALFALRGSVFEVVTPSSIHKLLGLPYNDQYLTL